MPLPEPVPGLVIRYSYLWRDEFRAGREEGVKDRPCAIIIVSRLEDGERMVTVLPITHSPPSSPELAVELPAATKQRLGLDARPSWIVLNEANRFAWPGPDLRFARAGDPFSAAFGLLPFALFETIKRKFVAAARARKVSLVPRSE